MIDRLDLPGQWPEVARRARGRARTRRALHGRLRGRSTRSAAARIEPANRRRVVRALEVTLGSGRPFSSFGPGLDAYPPHRRRADRPALAARRARRAHRARGSTAMIAAGLLDEVAPARARPGCRAPPRQALGYKELLDHLDGAVHARRRPSAAIVLRTRQFAVRQERWFRRDPRVRWIDIDTTTRVAERARRIVPSEHCGAMTALTLTKHHGLGNDFLVAFAPAAARGRPAGAGRGGCATAARHRRRRPARRRRPTPSYAAARWCCTTPTAAGPR